jgi:hypothetical protein
MGDDNFFVYFSGELSDDDRVALDRPGFNMYENGIAVSEPFFLPEGCADDLDTYTVVRVPAKSVLEARDAVVHALGRTPDDLNVWDPPDE